MLNRKIYSYLRNFFKNEKKALLVEGARQVGKTYADAIFRFKPL